jgi:exosortase K
VNALCVALVLAVDYAFKRFCSHASATELDFLLGPTAALVHAFTGHAFVAESGAGYFSRELYIVIAPACAGHNFVIVLFTALAVTFLGRFQSFPQKLAWLSVAAGLALTAGIVTNAARITLALFFHENQALDGVLSGAATHRALGIAVYLGALLSLHFGTARALGRRDAKTALPLACYLAVTLVTPLLGGAYATGAFWRHAAVVFGVTVLVGGVLWLWRRSGSIHVARRDEKIREPRHRTEEGAVADARISRSLGRARRSGERSLPGERDTPLVPASVA